MSAIAVSLVIAAGMSQTAEPPHLRLPAEAMLLADAAVVATETREALLTWDGKPSIAVESDERELVLRIDRLPSADAISRFTAQAGDALAQMRWTDRSMLIRAAPGWTVASHLDVATLRARFERRVRTEAGSRTTEERDYRLAEAAAASASGYAGRADRGLSVLEGDHSDDPAVIRARADLYRAAGRFQAAADRYREIDASDAAAISTFRNAGGEAGLDARHRSGRGFAQSEAVARLSLPLGGDAFVTSSLRGVRTVAREVMTPTGIRPRINRLSPLIEAGLSTYAGSMIRVDVQTSFDLRESRLGLDGRALFGPEERQLQLFGSFRLPDYSTAEQALLGGYIDRLGAGGAMRLSSAVFVQADAALARYGLRDEGRVARSTAVRGGLDLLLLRGKPTVQFAYRLSAEYFDDVARRGGFRVLSLQTRENHTAQMVATGLYGPVQVTAAAGWTADRYGSDGPTATVTADADAGRGWRLLASGGVTSISTNELSGTQLFLRLRLTKALGRP